MGQEITFSTIDDRITFDLSPFDVDILIKLGKFDEYRNYVKAVLEVDELTGEEDVAAKKLKDSIENILKVFKEKPDILPYTYLLESELDSNIGKLKSLCGRVSGTKINGSLYKIVGELNKCNLIPVTIGENGIGQEGEPIDIRDRKSIQTNNMGEIKIRKRKKTLSIVNNLKKLKSFLEKTEATIIHKTIM